MKRTRRILGLILAFIVTVAGVVNVKARNTEAAANKGMTAKQFVKSMGVGWNLGNSLDAASASKGYYLNTETLWNNPKVTRTLISKVAAAGFKSIRIPVTYLNHIDEKGVIDPAWLDRVEEVVNYALSSNLIVLINIHHDTGMNEKYRWIYADKDTYSVDVAKFTNLWTQIANRFKNYGTNLVFEAANEILDEDNTYLSPENSSVVHDLNQAFINAVRKTGKNNKNRYLGLATYAAGTQTEQTVGALAGGYTDVVKDRLMLAFHLYKYTESDIKRVINRVSTNAAKYNMPVYIGEFGTKSSLSLEERVMVAKAYATYARDCGIACFWWDNGTDYALFDRNTGEVLYKEIVNALIK